MFKILVFFYFNFYASWIPTSKVGQYVYQRPLVFDPEKCNNYIRKMVELDNRFVLVVVVDSIQGSMSSYCWDLFWDLDFKKIFKEDVSRLKSITNNKTLIMAVETNGGNYRVDFYKGSVVKGNIYKKSFKEIVSAMSEYFDRGDWGGGVYVGLEKIHYKFDHPDDWWIVIPVSIVGFLFLTGAIVVIVYFFCCGDKKHCRCCCRRCCCTPSTEEIAKKEMVKLEEIMNTNPKKVLFTPLCLECLLKFDDDHLQKMEKYAAYLEAHGSVGTKERIEYHRDTWPISASVSASTSIPLSSPASSSSSPRLSSSNFSGEDALALSFPAEYPSPPSPSSSFPSATATATTAAVAAVTAQLSAEYGSTSSSTIDVGTGTNTSTKHWYEHEKQTKGVGCTATVQAGADGAGVYTCNVCQRAIAGEGRRYRCLVCEDYDMCQTCFQTGDHNFTHGIRCFRHSSRTDESICFEDYYVETVVGAEPYGTMLYGLDVEVLHCGHQFHKVCVSISMIHHDECPYCKAPHPRALYPSDGDGGASLACSTSPSSLSFSSSSAEEAAVPVREQQQQPTQQQQLLPLYAKPLSQTFVEKLKEKIETWLWPAACEPCWD